MLRHAWIGSLVVGVALALWASPARAGPAYEILRFEEDWADLLCVPSCARKDPTDRLKALRLGRCVWADFGGQVRFRLENWENQNFVGANDDGWLLTRLRAHADLHVTRYARAFVEWIYADQADRRGGPRPIDENHHDLLNAFLDLQLPLRGGGEIGVRGGRQEMLFGRQRLISPLDWANTRRTFQGARAWCRDECRGWRIDGFAVRPIVVDRVAFDDWAAGTGFAGLYYQNRASKRIQWDVYALYLDQSAATYLGVTGEERRGTVGGLAFGEFGRGWDYDVEGGVQFGRFAGNDVRAGFASLALGYSLRPRDCGPFDGWVPRLAVGLDWASGSDGPGATNGTFNQLFPLGHAYFGYADLIGRQNVLAAMGRLEVKPTKPLLLRADYHQIWRANTGDAVYNAAGGVLRAPGGSGARHVMGELDVYLQYAVDRHWRVLGGWSHVFPGRFLSDTGPSLALDFFYAEAQWTF
jgi:hypothetical protein